MGVRDVAIQRVIKPILRDNQPKAAHRVARQAFDKAVDGIGPLKPASEDAENQLRKAGGNVPRAIEEIISDHVKFAAVEGFATNLGGLVSMAVLVPTNIAGLALLHCRMVAEIAHLRGYDLTDPRVRNAIFACMLGKDAVRDLVRDKKIPAAPYDIATGQPLDQQSADTIAAAVTAELIARAAGKSTFTFIGKRVPLLGGAVGSATDAWATRRIGKYAAKELRPLK